MKEFRYVRTPSKRNALLWLIFNAAVISFLLFQYVLLGTGLLYLILMSALTVFYALMFLGTRLPWIVRMDDEAIYLIVGRSLKSEVMYRDIARIEVYFSIKRSKMDIYSRRKEGVAMKIRDREIGMDNFLEIVGELRTLSGTYGFSFEENTSREKHILFFEDETAEGTDEMHDEAYRIK